MFRNTAIHHFDSIRSSARVIKAIQSDRYKYSSAIVCGNCGGGVNWTQIRSVHNISWWTYFWRHKCIFSIHFSCPFSKPDQTTKFKSHTKFEFFFIRFSVNFTLDACSSSRNIAYHFKTDFVNNRVIHNSKTVDSWNDEIIEENTWIEGAGNVYASIIYTV